jgi:hypothetical protein
MKKLLTSLIVAFSFAAFSQLPYTWVAGVNPGWTNSGALQWRSACGFVTTNCNGSYNNNMNTSYTSPVIDASCPDASTISVTFTAYGNIEYNYDFMFIEYSLNGGTTWNNPYGSGVAWTGDFGASPGTTIPPITLPATNNIRFRFTFQSDWLYTYSGLKLTDFDIVCNVVLPVEMTSFTAKRSGSENILEWSTLSEKNNDYFDVEWSTNPEAELWSSISIIPSQGNSETKQNYSIVHTDPTIGKKNYYRITQVDTDGTRRTYENLTVVDNSMKESPLKEIINLLGQVVDQNTPGIVIYIYEDGTKVKRYQ